MGRSAALPIRHIPGPRARAIAHPVRVPLRVVSRPRRRVRRAPNPLFIAIEWGVLTMLGAAVLALAAG